MKDTNKKILVIISTFEEYCQGTIWDGLAEEAELDKIDLVTIPFSFQSRYDLLHTNLFFIKEFIDNHYFDGIIFFTGAVSEHTSLNTLKAMLSHTDLPIVGIAGELGIGLDVTVNNKPGIIDLIDHFVEKHDAKSIAFIRGPKSNLEAEERFEAYQEGLEKNDIPFNANLVFNGTFSEKSGINAVKKLLSSGTECDAIIGADDYTALGALKELKRQKFAVPHSIKVAGFDDIEETILYSPSLTTVKQPFRLLGRKAVQLMKHIWDGVEDKIHSGIDTYPIFRESCSCSVEDVKIVKLSNMKVRKELNFLLDCSESVQHIIQSNSLKELQDTLLYECKTLEISELTLVLFDDIFHYGNCNSSCFMISKKGRSYETDIIEFNSSEIFPQEKIADFHSSNYLWLPLVFREKYYGYLHLPVQEDIPKIAYEELRRAVALSIHLMRE